MTYEEARAKFPIGTIVRRISEHEDGRGDPWALVDDDDPRYLKALNHKPGHVRQNWDTGLDGFLPARNLRTNDIDGMKPFHLVWANEASCCADCNGPAPLNDYLCGDCRAGL